MIINGNIRPDTPIINEYATNEGEEFIISVFDAISRNQRDDSSLFSQMADVLSTTVFTGIDFRNDGLG